MFRKNQGWSETVDLIRDASKEIQQKEADALAFLSADMKSVPDAQRILADLALMQFEAVTSGEWLTSIRRATKPARASTTRSRGRVMDAYAQFLERKRMVDPATGLRIVPPLRPISNRISATLPHGPCAVDAPPCSPGQGLGKTLIELVWGAEVARHTGKPVLAFAPLAVSAQHIRRPRSSAFMPKWRATSPTSATAYSSRTIRRSTISTCLVRRRDPGRIQHPQVNGRPLSQPADRECASVLFRLAATATPAPNDFMELGNHAEFLSVMSHTDMLATFFTHDGGDTQKWRLKGHAENEF